MQPAVDEYMLEADEAGSRPFMQSFEQACRRLVDAGAEVVIPGDGFLNEMVWRHGLKTVAGVPVMDALGTLFHHALFMANLQTRLGTGVSRAFYYASPPARMLDSARKAAGAHAMAEEEFSGRAGDRAGEG